MNEQSIEVAKINLNASDLNFKTRVSGVITNVLNAYYQLAGDFEDLRAKQDAVETADTTVRQNSRRLQLGALAQLDVTTAQNQLAAARQSLVNSQSAMRGRDDAEESDQPDRNRRSRDCRSPGSFRSIES